ncbi:MAG: hypothetical protein N2652_06350 [Kiritimatiellae bacterium]|nr:hypothetical protein [Kiritimatiellia bacterium]
MHLTLAGRDDEALAERVRALARTLPEHAGPPSLSPEHRALRLRECEGPPSFDALALELLRYHIALDTRPTTCARAASLPNRLLEALRRVLWRLLGNPLDRIALQQTRVNELLLDALCRAVAESSRSPAGPTPPTPPANAP